MALFAGNKKGNTYKQSVTKLVKLCQMKRLFKKKEKF